MVPAQQHAGHNIGDRDTHVLFIELKDSPQATGPSAPQTVASPGPDLA